MWAWSDVFDFKPVAEFVELFRLETRSIVRNDCFSLAETLGPKLNRPPKNGNNHVQNCYDTLSDMEEDYYGADQDITQCLVFFFIQWNISIAS